MKYLPFGFFLLMSFTIQAQSKKWEQLFDGKTLKGWSVKAGNADYQVIDRTIVGTTVTGSPNTFLVSDKEYENYILEVDFRLEDTTLNSGIQFSSHYDSKENNGRGKVYGYQYELDPSFRSWTAGIYEEGRRGWLYPLTLNPAAKRGYHYYDFNTARIECFGNTVKTYINGILASVLVDSIKEKGFIALQVHSISDPKNAGKHIYWKNIKIKTLDAPITDKELPYIVNLNQNSVSDWEKSKGYQLLFDGKSTTGWKGAYKPGFPEKGWEVKDGTLTVLSSAGKESANGGDIVTIEEYSAFDLSFDFKLTEGGNSGVKYFVTLTENNTGSAIGLEYQILDDKRHPDALLGKNGNRTLASLYDLIPANKQSRFFNEPGNWNTGRVVVYPDNRVEHYLNGVKVLEYIRGSEEFRKLVAESKYKIWPSFGEAPKGHILLQDHGNEVSFRNIKIAKL
ncbi:MAG TPA: DUF1080 domain-containing protein [Flavitalea sp.]|nr:DUF1080 domain-containing protein [Flavitalea sp.]